MFDVKVISIEELLRTHHMPGELFKMDPGALGLDWIDSTGNPRLLREAKQAAMRLNKPCIAILSDDEENTADYALAVLHRNSCLKVTLFNSKKCLFGGIKVVSFSMMGRKVSRIRYKKGSTIL